MKRLPVPIVILNRLTRRDSVARRHASRLVFCMYVRTYIKLHHRRRLQKDAVLTIDSRLKEIYTDEKVMLESIGDILSQNEYDYTKSTMNKTAVPTVKLLIKDGKPKEENGNPKIRLVIPSKNCTAGFPHVG